MEYSKINELKLSQITLGTVQLGIDYGIANKSGKPSVDCAFDILETAINGGINSFDTANIYGDSEEILGKYFSSSRNELKAPYISTKFKIEPEKGTDKNSIEKQIYDFAENSLSKLKINKIPLYMLHSAEDMWLYGDAVRQTLAKLKNEGLIEKAGVSVYEVSEAERMLNDGLYEAIQIPMNIFDLRMAHSGVLEKLKNSDTLIFVRSVFLQGLFFLNPDTLPEGFKSARKYLEKLNTISKEADISIAQLAISYIRDLDGVSSLVLGAETPDQIKDSINLINSPKISKEVAAIIDEMSREVPIDVIMQEIRRKKV